MILRILYRIKGSYSAYEKMSIINEENQIRVNATLRKHNLSSNVITLPIMNSGFRNNLFTGKFFCGAIAFLLLKIETNWLSLNSCLFIFYSLN